LVECRVDWTAGKWRRAVSNVEDMRAAQEALNIEVVEIISPAVDVLSTTQNDNVVDLYSVGHEEVTRVMCNTGVEVPFQNTLHLLGPQGEIVRVAALFDGCAMVSAMCVTVFEKVRHRLGEWRPSDKQLRMGNGAIIPSLAVWKGEMRLGEVTVKGEFEVFDSGGSWAFLLGKPLLRTFRATQAYETDTVSICGIDNKKVLLFNEIKTPRARGNKPGVNLTLDVKQCNVATGGSLATNPPLREVLNDTAHEPPEAHTDITVFPVSVATPQKEPNPILTREHNPHKPERVARILQEVTIGPDVTQEQHLVIHELLREYVDCFALSIKEVNTIPGAVHKLNIPEGATFHTRIPPRSYNPDQ
jgi:intracellular sulfur oxidation DsrE/DsrF family protein